MPLASLRCRSARFDDGRLNQKVKIATLKNKSADQAMLDVRSHHRTGSSIEQALVQMIEDVG